jgi:hypothetical protein
MKHSIWILLVLLVFGAAACKGACTSKDQAVKEGVETAKEEAGAPAADKEAGAPAAAVPGQATGDDIADQIGKSLCARVVQCAPNTMTEAECVAETSKSLKEALKEKTLNITREQLTGCVTSINNGTCDEVMGQKAPKGCDFLD